MFKRFFSVFTCLCLLTGLFASGACVSRAEEIVTGTVCVDDYLNVRSGPGTGNSIIGKLYNNDQVTILKTIPSGAVTWYEISTPELSGYVSAAYVTQNVLYQWDETFEQYLSAQGFPDSYKPYLRQIHAQHPGWVFKAQTLSMTWEEAVSAESKVGLNTIQSPDAWKSMEEGAYNWDTGSYVSFDSGGWVSAYPGVIAYYMDPRTFLNSTYIFQFEELSYDADHTLEGVQAILPGALDPYAQDVLNAARDSGVSAYFLASRMTQEGTHLNGLGTGTVPGYEGYYNFFDYGASAHDGNSAVINGAIYAKKHGWDTPYKSIAASAEMIGQYYIKQGQNTYYYQKFNVINAGSGLYAHQYMTNVAAAASEGVIRHDAATPEQLNTSLVFLIPVYRDMPDTAVSRPCSDGNNNTLLSSLTVDGQTLTPSFSRYTTEYSLQVNPGTDTVNIAALAADGGARVDGVGAVHMDTGTTEHKLTVTSTSGAVRIYTLQLTRPSARQIFLSDGVWNCGENGQRDTQYTGMCQYYGTWYYVRQGILDWSYTGLCEYYGTWFYVENGSVNPGTTTLILWNGTWYYVENGTINWNATTLCLYYGTWYYVENGVLNWNATTLCLYYGTWYYVENGVINWNATTLCLYYGTWYYVENGVINWNATTLCLYYGTWYYVENGVINWNATTLCLYYGTWYYVENGAINWNAITLVNYYGTWYYVRGGSVGWTYTGSCRYYGVSYRVRGGVVVF